MQRSLQLGKAKQLNDKANQFCINARKDKKIQRLNRSKNGRNIS